jgi:hypothetical protein
VKASLRWRVDKQGMAPSSPENRMQPAWAECVGYARGLQKARRVTGLAGFGILAADSGILAVSSRWQWPALGGHAHLPTPRPPLRGLEPHESLHVVTTGTAGVTHIDNQANAAARSVNARAFTSGRDIVF